MVGSFVNKIFVLDYEILGFCVDNDDWRNIYGKSLKKTKGLVFIAI